MYPIKNYKKVKRGYEHGEKTFYSNFHFGVDLIVPKGTPIYAHTDGYLWRRKGKQAGNMAMFKDVKGNIVRHMHCRTVNLNGEYKKGDLLAFSGNTGLSTAPHIHTDVSVNKVNLKDRNNFIDPDDYFMRRIKYTIVSDKDTSWDKVSDWYEKRGVDLEISEARLDKTPVWKNSKKIDMDWWDRHVAPLASGSDIVVLVMDRDDWKRKGDLGYANHKQRLGLWNAFAVRHVGRRKNVSSLPDNTIGTVIHEISHLAHRACNQTDETHKLDYQGKLEDINIDWDKFNGWEIQGATRLFKYSKRKKQVIQRIVRDSIASKFKQGIGYWKLMGGYSTNIPNNKLR